LQGSSKFEEVDLTRFFVEDLVFGSCRCWGCSCGGAVVKGVSLFISCNFQDNFVSVQVAVSIAAFLMAIEEFVK
jgi:hypothetical protein